MIENPLDHWRDREDLKLDELVHAAAEVIPHLATRPNHGRATPIPDARTVRYYIGHGLVDRPHGTEGTAALYGFRHLLQLVAVKVLQGQHLPLDRVREALDGLDNDQLELQLQGWAATPREMWVTSPGEWGARRWRSGAKGFAKMTKAAVRDESAIRSKQATQSLSLSSDQLSAGERPDEDSDVSAEHVMFDQSLGTDRMSEGDPPAPERTPGDPQGWQRYELHPGIELHVREGTEFPASPSFLSALASRLRAILTRRARKK